MTEYITLKDAARILGVSQVTVKNFILRDKLFKAKKFGRQYRIDKESFAEYIEKSEVK